VHAVREQDDEHLPLRIDPQRRAGVAGVPVRRAAQVLSRAAVAVRRVPAECARARRPRREEPHGRIADDANAAELAAVQQHLREDGEVLRRAEETGVPGDAAEGVGVLVVHLAAQRVAARRHHFRRRDPRDERVRGTEEGVLHAERAEDALVEEDVERRARDRLDDEAQEIGAEVGVDVARPGDVGEFGSDRVAARLLGAVRDAPEIAPRRESRAVREELPDRHRVLPPAGELGDVVADVGVEVQQPLVEEDHRGRRRADDLRERGEIVDRRRRIDRGARRRPVEMPEAALPDRLPLAPHDHGRAGIAALPDAARDDPVDGLETSRRHADGLRCGGLEATAVRDGEGCGEQQ
jgi:hypothetical protein